MLVTIKIICSRNLPSKLPGNKRAEIFRYPSLFNPEYYLPRVICKLGLPQSLGTGPSELPTLQAPTFPYL